MFGEHIPNKSFKVVDEITMRISSGVIFLIAITAFVNGFILNNFSVLPFITGFLVLNFAIGLFIDLKYAPTFLLSRLYRGKQIEKPIGAIQKKFAWSLGLILASVIFTLSIFLVSIPGLFNTVCFLCLICLGILFFEVVFGVCIGCELYFTAIDMKLIKTPKPEDKPNCMGDKCEI